jgi:hypothetical protein
VAHTISGRLETGKCGYLEHAPPKRAGSRACRDGKQAMS